MTKNAVQFVIPFVLLLMAFLFMVFGSHFVNAGYGVERNASLTTPTTILSTLDDYASLDDLKGHTTYLTFGFSHCADSCPTTLAQFIKLSATLPNDARLVFVSIDGQRDNIGHLKHYLAQVDPTIIGWRMDDDQLRAFSQQFGTTITVQADGELQHSPAIQVIDKTGKWVKTYPYLTLDEHTVLADYWALNSAT